MIRRTCRPPTLNDIATLGASMRPMDRMECELIAGLAPTQALSECVANAASAIAAEVVEAAWAATRATRCAAVGRRPLRTRKSIASFLRAHSSSRSCCSNSWRAARIWLSVISLRWADMAGLGDGNRVLPSLLLP